MKHRPRREDSVKTDLGGIGLGGGRSVDSSINKPTVSSPHTWVFSTRPRFVRHQKPFEKSLLVEKVTEPAVNVLEEIKEVVVLAQMPGVDEESISCEVKDDILSISAEASDSLGAKRYEREILLPFIVSPDSLRTSYDNQILEIKLKRTERGKSERKKSRKRR
jgi:HSP20 family molecular chaperone IbpA